MLQLERSDSSGIEPMTLKELQVLLNDQINKGRGDKKIAIDDDCGHWYWLKTDFSCVEDVVLIGVTQYVDDYTPEFIDEQPDLNSILQSVNEFINEDNQDKEVFGEWSGSIDCACNVPKHLFCYSIRDKDKAAGVTLEFDDTTLILSN